MSGGRGRPPAPGGPEREELLARLADRARFIRLETVRLADIPGATEEIMGVEPAAACSGRPAETAMADPVPARAGQELSGLFSGTAGAAPLRDPRSAIHPLDTAEVLLAR